MVEVARLLLEIDSSGAAKGAKDAAAALDQTAAAATRAVTATEKVGGSAKDTASALKATGAATSELASKTDEAAEASERLGRASFSSKRLAKELAGEFLGLHGGLVSLVTELGNVEHLLGALGAIATSPLGVIAGGAIAFKVFSAAMHTASLDLAEHIEQVEKLGKAYGDAAYSRGELNKITSHSYTDLEGKPYTQVGTLYGASPGAQRALDELAGTLTSSAGSKLSSGGDQTTDEARAQIGRVQGQLLTLIQDLGKESIQVQTAIESAIANTVKGGLYSNPQVTEAFEKAVDDTIKATEAAHRQAAAIEVANAAIEKEVDLLKQRAAVESAAGAQFQSTVAGLNRITAFAGQGSDAVDRATKIQNAYDLALKATGGDAQRAGVLFQSYVSALEASDAATKNAKDAADEMQEILRGNAKLDAELAADADARAKRVASARETADTSLAGASRRAATYGGPLPQSLGEIDALKRELAIQDAVANFKKSIAALPIDEQIAKAAEFEAATRTAADGVDAWAKQEDHLKEVQREAGKAIEEQKKRVEDLAHAYADPLGKGLDDLFGKLQDGELSWRSFAETALNAMKEISAGVFHELVTRPFTESIVNTLTGRSGNGGGLGGDFYGGSGGGGGGFGSGDSSNYGAVGLSGASAASGVFASAAGSGVGAGLRKWLPSLFGGRTSNPPYPDALNAAYERAQSGTPSFDASDAFNFGTGASATAQPSAGLVDPKSTPGGTGGFGFMDFFNLLGLGTQSWLQNPGGLFLGGGGGGGFGFGFARGAAFSRGRVIPFYRGDVFDNPTTFPMAGGDTGLLGERGPEAILPLSRGSDGRLGVRASGARGGSGDERDRGGGTTVINNWRITTPNADSFRKSKRHMDQDEKRRASRG